MRVVAGIAGGLPLESPKGVDLRPTQDRIKQTIFSSLAERIPETRILDLYAGTGGLGIEALSRGAQSAVFVDENKRCVEVIRRNLERCGFRAQVVCQEALAFLRTLPPSPAFDLIFADPPYEKNKESIDQHPLLAALFPVLNSDGLFIWEHFAGQKISSPDLWEIVRHRCYGETGLTFLRKKK
jgi:16S rRNA (guanine966-N2)-methyltransferase